MKSRSKNKRKSRTKIRRQSSRKSRRESRRKKAGRARSFCEQHHPRHAFPRPSCLK